MVGLTIGSDKYIKVSSVGYGVSIHTTIPSALVIVVLKDQIPPTIVYFHNRIGEALNSWDSKEVIDCIIIRGENIGNFGIASD